MGNLTDLTGKSTKYREIKEIMQQPSMKAKLVSYIDSAVKAKGKIAFHQETIKRIREDAMEELGIKPAMFNQYVAMTFNNDYVQRKEKLEESIDLIDYILEDANLIPIVSPSSGDDE